MAPTTSHIHTHHSTLSTVQLDVHIMFVGSLAPLPCVWNESLRPGSFCVSLRCMLKLSDAAALLQADPPQVACDSLLQVVVDDAACVRMKVETSPP